MKPGKLKIKEDRASGTRSCERFRSLTHESTCDNVLCELFSGLQWSSGSLENEKYDFAQFTLGHGTQKAGACYFSRKQAVNKMVGPGESRTFTTASSSPGILTSDNSVPWSVRVIDCRLGYKRDSWLIFVWKIANFYDYLPANYRGNFSNFS